MPVDRAQLLQHYRDMRATLLAAIAGLTEQQLIEPSIDGWSVKHHLFHLAAWDEIRANEVRRISAGQESAWRGRGDEDEAFNAIATALRRDLSLVQARWELAQSRQWLLDAIESATERGLDASLYGEAALESTHEAQHTAWIVRWRALRGF